MAANIRELVVFVASPGDLKEERVAVRQAAEMLNNQHSSLTTVRIRVTGWENVQPEHERPQEVINALVDECDVFLGLLFRKWGSPTGEYDSGFEEEYERALKRRTESGCPNIAIYFKKVSQELLSDPGPQLLKVLEFQRRFQEEHSALYREFPSLEDFKLKVYTFFNSLLISNMQPESLPSQPEGTVAKRPEPSTEVTHATNTDPARRQISETLSAFAELAATGSSPQDLDVDRLLMVSLAFQPEKVAIPVHALNRLYGSRTGLQISAMEYRLLVWTLADGYGHAAKEAPNVSVPVWYFLAARDADGMRDLTDILVSISFDDHDNFVARCGAIRLLSFIGVKPVELWPSDGEDVGISYPSLASTDSDSQEEIPPIERWEQHLNNKNSTSLALDYMAEVATSVDVDFIMALAERVESSSHRSQLQAIASYLSGNIHRLIQCASSYVSDGSWEERFLTHAIERAEDDDLLRLIDARNVPITLNVRALEEITSRRALTMAEISRVLGRKQEQLMAGLFEALDKRGCTDFKIAFLEAIASFESRDIVRDHKSRLLALTHSIEDVRVLVADTFKALDAWPALAILEGPAALADEARRILDTDCSSHINIAELESAGYKGSVLDFVRGELRRAALQVLEQLPENLRENDSDTQRVRNELRLRYIVTQETAALILLDWGGEEDAPVILEVADGVLRNKQALISGSIKLGGIRFARQCLTDSDPDKALLASKALIEQHNVGLRELKGMLYSSHSSVRIQVINELRKRLTDAQLGDYISEYRKESTGYYYDVVAAIDRMLYAPELLAGYRD
ncbi:DUF4062 domain-containing protein [Streptomyces cyaneofuscatus]|uniref:DUF4062 domain-containing protein n=1 Tax=Streptomyces TaxID=1883 RepID=UPI00344F4D9D